MLLRPGNAGPDTFTDHKEVLAAAIGQVPVRFRARVLVRADGAGASHDLVKYLLSMSSPRRKALFTSGWIITAADEAAIGRCPPPRGSPVRPGRRHRAGQGCHGDHRLIEPRRELARRAAMDPAGPGRPPADAEPDRL